MVLLSILVFQPTTDLHRCRRTACLRSGIFILMGAMIMANALHAFILDPAQSYDAAGLLWAAVCGMNGWQVKRIARRVVVRSS